MAPNPFLAGARLPYRTHGSLFSGIDAPSIAFETLGVETSWQCENNDYCRRVLDLRWLDSPVYPDVREVGPGTPRVDVLSAGFP